MAKKGPLKKVVREFTRNERNFHGTVMKGLFFFEELECGHIIPKPSDLHGHYDSVKRRCTQCSAEHSAHPTPHKQDENPATWVIDPNNITPPAISG